MPMTPRCQPSPATTRMLWAPTRTSVSTCFFASATMSASYAWRRVFSSPSCSASRRTSSSCVSSLARSSRVARSGVLMRPAALTRGAITNATWKPSMVLFCRPADSSSVRRPTVCGPCDRRSSPSLAMMRFSPTSGTTSATVPIAASLRNAGSHFSPVEPLTQRLDDLERDADARQVLVRIGAVGTLRVDHRERRRQLRLRLVVVGDDEVDAELAGPARRLGTADAAVHRHDHAHAIGVQALDRGHLQAVAVAQPFRDEVRDVAAEQFQRPAQDDRGGHAVDVVVAVDRDALLALERGTEPIDGRPHVGEAIRVVQLRELRVAGSGAPPPDRHGRDAEQAGDDRRHVEGGGQRLRGRLVTHDGVPDQCPHGAAIPSRGIRRPYRRSRRRGGRCGGTSRTDARGVRRRSSPSAAAAPARARRRGAEAARS